MTIAATGLTDYAAMVVVLIAFMLGVYTGWIAEALADAYDDRRDNDRDRLDP